MSEVLTCQTFPPDLKSTPEHPSQIFEPIPPDKVVTSPQDDLIPVNSPLVTDTPTSRTVDPPLEEPSPDTVDGPRRSTRPTQTPGFYGVNTASTAKDHDHPTYHIAMNDPDK